MTAIDGQLDIFDQLNPVRTVECPHCGVVWTPGKHLDDEQALDVHTRRNGGPDEDMPGSASVSVWPSPGCASSST